MKYLLIIIFLPVFILHIASCGHNKCIQGICLSVQRTLTWPDGTKYIGELKDNLMNGQGSITFPDGTKYVGEFQNDERHGQGSYIYADGRVEKKIMSHDHNRLDEGISKAKEIMVESGVSGPFVEGVHHGGHLGGTVPLKKEDVALMKPSWLPDDLWVADLSLAPRSQGLPTSLLASALALRVARKIAEAKI